MPQDPNSLDRLNDIVLPPEVAWWPLAPGWYVLMLSILLLGSWFAMRWMKQWQANAYRRIALRELAETKDPASIAELLRRTALAVAPREEIARLTGDRWVDWLATHCPINQPPEVRVQLNVGVYQRDDQSVNVNVLREYAAQWISHHDRPAWEH